MKELTLKIAFALFADRKSRNFRKNKNNFQKQTNTKTIKSSGSGVAIFISQGHSTSELGAFFDFSPFYFPITKKAPLVLLA